jgi:hypothetical protein
MKLLLNRPVFKGSRISMEFDIFGYVLIFLMIFGHNLGTRFWFLIEVGNLLEWRWGKGTPARKGTKLREMEGEQ